MKIKCFLITLLFFPLTVMADSMQCDYGPIEKDFGGGTWVVYACSDNESIVAVTPAGNPASPFFFFIGRMKDGSYGIAGEGEGDKTASKAALDDLAKLSKSDVDDIIIEAQGL